MSVETIEQPTTQANPSQSDDLGIDRAFLLNMARVPMIACIWFAAAWAYEPRCRSVRLADPC